MKSAIYIRKSREDKTKAAYRLSYQREQLPVYAEKQGWKAKVYDDGHASAARGKTEDLKARAELENDIRAGKINIVLVIELSRLSRDDSLQDYVAWLTLCADHNVKLATMSRVLDPTQHSDWMLLLMEGGFSSMEMRVIHTRLTEGRTQALRAGKWIGGTPPLPYKYDKAAGKPVVDKKQLRKMKKLWKMAETQSAKSIAKELGMPEISVRRSISDNRLLFYQALRTDPENGDLIECDWEPVMDSDQADRIRSGRRTRKNYTTPRSAAALLSNLNILRCAYCNRTVKTWNNSKIRLDGTRLDYYGCQVKSDRYACPKSRMIPQTIINEKVLNNLFGVLGRLDQLREHWLDEQANFDPTKKLQDLADQEKKQKDKKLRLINAISEGIIELIDARTQMNEIKSALAEIDSNRNKTLNQAADPPNWNSIAIGRQRFNKMSFEKQREVIKTAFKEIRIYRNYANLTYNFPLDSKGKRTARINLPASKRCGRQTNYKL